MVVTFVFTFAVFNLLSPLIAWLGQGGMMYFFAVCSFVGGTFIARYMPETMGKTFEEIEEMLSN